MTTPTSSYRLFLQVAIAFIVLTTLGLAASPIFSEALPIPGDVVFAIDVIIIVGLGLAFLRTHPDAPRSGDSAPRPEDLPEAPKPGPKVESQTADEETSAEQGA